MCSLHSIIIGKLTSLSECWGPVPVHTYGPYQNPVYSAPPPIAPSLCIPCCHCTVAACHYQRVTVIGRCLPFRSRAAMIGCRLMFRKNEAPCCESLAHTIRRLNPSERIVRGGGHYARSLGSMLVQRDVAAHRPSP